MWTSMANGEIKGIDAAGRFAGYASVFDIVDQQRDMVVAGAFHEAVAKSRSAVKLLWQHQWQEPIGRIDVLFEDRYGLYIEAQLLLDVARAKEAYVLLKEGVLNGLSIGYRPEKFRVDADTGVRILSDVTLYEISLVTMPANPQALIRLVKQQASDDMNCAPLMAALSQAERALLVAMR